jgi:hypothetical protein
MILTGVLLSVAGMAGLWLVSSRESRVQSEADISEAVFRQLLEMPDLTDLPDGNGVCVSNGSHRFDSKFLDRFRNTFPAVRLTLDREYQQKAVAPTDKPSEKCRIVIQIQEIRWQSSSDVNVTAGYNCGPLCTYGGSFHLRRAGWGWYVDSASNNYISHLIRPRTKSRPTIFLASQPKK